MADNYNSWQKRVDEKLDKLDERLDNIDKNLAVYNVQLEKHIEGVKQARLENDQTREILLLKEKEIQEEIKPIKKHVDLVNLIVKIVISSAGAVGVILGIIKTLKELGLL